MSVLPLETEITGLRRDLYKCWGKRVFDIAAATIGLVFLTPILTLCAVLIRITSRGPVFFRQVRIGQHGHKFKIYKFRTLHQWASQLGHAVVVPGDDRLTFVGGFLRRTKVDELPQLINVCVGT